MKALSVKHTSEEELAQIRRLLDSFDEDKDGVDQLL
jgi:hypothetical protein